MKDPYKILGIKRDADSKSIKKTYHKLALKFHPDKNPDDPKAEEKFKEITSAYEILNDSEKRLQYDTYGDLSSNVFSKGQDPFEHIINSVRNSGFWNMGSRQRSVRGDNIQQTIDLNFIDAAKGITKKISIDYPHSCDACKGNGSKDGTSLKTCEMCNGSGKIGQNRGMMQILHSCPTCKGTGSIITEGCTNCNGRGIKTKNEILKVTIPAGINEGTTMRLAGKGMPSQYGAENGDLFLSIVIADHPIFKRDGVTVYSKITINYLDAILGAQIPIETIHGGVKLKIPSGTQPNSVLKVAGKGVVRGTIKGDHLVGIKIEIPNKISSREKDLLNELKDIKA